MQTVRSVHDALGVLSPSQTSIRSVPLVRSIKNLQRQWNMDEKISELRGDCLHNALISLNGLAFTGLR